MATLAVRLGLTSADDSTGSGAARVLGTVIVLAMGVGLAYPLGRRGPAGVLPVLGAASAFSYLVAAVAYPGLGVWSVALVGPVVGALLVLARGSGLSLLFDLLVILPLLALVLRWLVRPDRVTMWSGLPGLVWALVGMAVFQIVTSEPHLMVPGIYGFRREVLPALLFVVAYNLDLSSRSRLDRILTGFVAVGAVTAIWGLRQHFVGLTRAEAEYAAGIGTFWVDGNDLRIFASLTSPWAFAAYQAMIGILAAAMSFRLRGGRRVLMCVCWGLATLALALTQMRGPFLGYVFGLIFLALVVVGNRLGRRRIVLAFCGCLVAYVLFVVAAGPELAQQLKPESVVGQRLMSIATPLQEEAVDARFVTWQRIWPIIVRHPLGLGLGTTEGVALRFDELLRFGSIRSDNLYLAVLLEMGWPGSVLLVTIVLSVMVTGLRRLGMGACQSEDVVRGGLLASLVMMAIGNLATPLGFEPVAAHVYWVVAGITVNPSWAPSIRGSS